MDDMGANAPGAPKKVTTTPGDASDSYLMLLALVIDRVGLGIMSQHINCTEQVLPWHAPLNNDNLYFFFVQPLER